MGCGGSKDHTEDSGDAPAPDLTPEQQKEDKVQSAAVDKSFDHLSNDLRTLMHDYFNRYDLDGSQTINSSEELKQLCTNLVVKLDLPMDVAKIDELVASAGAFQDDDPPEGGWPTDAPKRNEWKQVTFVSWFMAPDKFAPDTNWLTGDISDEDDDGTPTEDKPFMIGTYVGVLEGDGKQYIKKERIGGKVVDEKLEGCTIRETPTFSFRIRPETGDTATGPLKPRDGCDAIGIYRTSGNIEGTKITMCLEYDVDNDAATKEPKLVLEGKWAGAEDPTSITGTWKNANADDADAAAQMDLLGLAGVQEGTFKLTKRVRDDEM